MSKGIKTKTRRRPFKYDAALSFAGEDRQLAESLFRCLRARGLSIFYDADREAHLWGKTSAEFEKIYGPQTRYVIPLVSKHYIQKRWTRFEFDTALHEQEQRRGEFILPISIDDSRLLGLPSDVIRQDARKRSVEEIATAFAEKCRPTRRAGPASGRGQHHMVVRLLRPESRRVLGLIATSPIPLPRAYFERLFPECDWKRQVAEFRRAGLVLNSDPALRLSDAATKTLLADNDFTGHIRGVWIDRLRPLADHVDTGAFLSIQFLLSRKFDEAGGVACNIAQYTKLGWWNEIYLTILSALGRRSVFRKLSPGIKVELLNSLGSCLSEAGKYREAIRTFGQLRRVSKRYRNLWGVGQSLINAGVAAHGMGDNGTAEKLYRAAIVHARRSRDKMLLGRALGNLAQIYQDKDIQQAEHFLEQSMQAKTAAHDSVGLVGSLIVRGNLSVARKDFAAGAGWYRAASRAAKTMGLRHEQALSTYNYARALQDLLRPGSASRMYELARKLATPDDYTDVLQLSLNALAANAFSDGRYSEAYLHAKELLAIAKRREDRDYELGALHMLAVSSLAQGKRSRSYHEFRAAVAAARRHGAEVWIVRGIVDSTRQLVDGCLSAPNASRIRRFARTEARRKRYGTAARLWQTVARICAERGADREASEAYDLAADYLLRRHELAAYAIELFRAWFVWAWDARRYSESLVILKKLEAFAQRHGCEAEAAAATDQRAVCLQELGRHSDAVPLHRAAASMAARIGNNEQRQGSLNNLGEALRRLGRHAEAIRAFRSSERLAKMASRHESAISTAHNRALALEEMGRGVEAARLLRTCRDASRHRKLWYEHVRAWEALANLSWTAGRRRAAIRLYRRAKQAARTLGIGALEPRIALNLARALRSEHKAAAALETLERHREAFEGYVDSYEYIGTLADLYAACGRAQDAADAWEGAKAHAASVGATEYASYCASQQARALLQLGAAGKADATLRDVLAREQDPTRRANLLIQRMRLLFHGKRSKQAKEVFDETARLCDEHGLHEQKIESHLAVGDSLLEGSYKSKLEGFKAYVVALMIATESDLHGFGPAGSHILLKLSAATAPVGQEELRRIIRDLTSDLSSKANGAARAVRLLLWPFNLALQVFPVRRHRARVAALLRQLTSAPALDRYLEGVDEVPRDGADPTVRTKERCSGADEKPR